MTLQQFALHRRSPRQRNRIVLAAVATALVGAPGGGALAQGSGNQVAPAVQTAGPGYQAATNAFAALERRDYAAAVVAASDAVRLEPANRGYRLALADAYLGAEQPQAALSTLDPLRLDPSFEVQSRLGSTLSQLDQHSEAAVAFGAASAAAPSADGRAYATRARVLALIESGAVVRAQSDFLSALEAGTLDGSSPLDMAVLAVAVGEDAVAQPFYAEAANSGQVSGRAALDAGYSARRARNDRAAIDYFSRGVDGALEGAFALTPQALFDVRRDVANLDRTWGASGSISYGASSTAGIPTSPGSADSLQGGVEVYRRIGGYRAGAPFDVFARVFETIDADTGATGGDSRQGWIGARWKPLTDANLVLEGSRMIKLGDSARNDWMVRTSYSREQGTDIRVDRRSWPMWRLYADASYIIDNQQTFGVADVRAGRSFALGADNRTVVSVFGSVGLNYDSALGTSEAVGAGPGLSLRRWFRETQHAAPRSFVDLTLEYRFRLAGDDRAEGLFATFSVSY